LIHEICTKVDDCSSGRDLFTYLFVYWHNCLLTYLLIWVVSLDVHKACLHGVSSRQTPL
jgi:hypothetical protein